MASLFGDAQLSTKEGPVAASAALEKAKLVGIYFSAHWCPPCRGFTPVLADFYHSAKEADPNLLEVVFVSSDRDQDNYESYYAEMPWLSLPFDNSDLKDELSKKFSVRGIPYLVILDKEGNVVDPAGRATVTDANKKEPSAAFTKWGV